MRSDNTFKSYEVGQHLRQIIYFEVGHHFKRGPPVLNVSSFEPKNLLGDFVLHLPVRKKKSTCKGDDFQPTLHVNLAHRPPPVGGAMGQLVLYYYMTKDSKMSNLEQREHLARLFDKKEVVCPLLAVSAKTRSHPRNTP